MSDMKEERSRKHKRPRRDVGTDDDHPKENEQHSDVKSKNKVHRKRNSDTDQVVFEDGENSSHEKERRHRHKHERGDRHVEDEDDRMKIDGRNRREKQSDRRTDGETQIRRERSERDESSTQNEDKRRGNEKEEPYVRSRQNIGTSESEEDVGDEIRKHVNRVKSVVAHAVVDSRNIRGDRRDRDRHDDRLDRPERDILRVRDEDDDRRRRRERDVDSSHRQVRDERVRRRHDSSPDVRQSPPEKESAAKEDVEYIAKKRARNEDESLTTKTGGAYIPPARLRALQAQVTDKSSVQFQRLSWELLKKSINGKINKVNVANMVIVVRELFQENVVRGRGLLARSIMQAQAASPTYTHVYAALVAVINTKFPQIGELILKRLSIQFKRGFKRNDKALCLSSTRFIAHLVNQQVAHEILSLEILTLLLESPTDDSVEVAIGFLKECGKKLTEVSPKGINATFERLRIVLHEARIDKRVQYMIEVMFAVRKDGFKDFPAVIEALDVVEEEDQCTHMVALDDAVDPEDALNVFKLDEAFEASEEAYKAIRRDILDEGSSDEDGEEGGSGDSDSEEDEEKAAAEEAKKTLIIDQTETTLSSLRVTIYLTIQSSLDFEECAHKLLKMNMKPGQEVELCNMILDCCAQQRTYEKFYGLLGQRFCMIDRKYIGPYQRMFKEQYDTIHRLETNKLRNIAKFFGHLLHTDAISWEVMLTVKLTEEDTTSSSRIFIKILFQELSEYMGLHKLNQRLKDPTLQAFFEGLFPRDRPKNTRFAINFFTSVGLGGLTDELREHLKTAPRVEAVDVKVEEEEDSDDSSSSSDDSSSDDSSSDSSSEDSSDDSDDAPSSKRPKRVAPSHAPQPSAHASRSNAPSRKGQAPSKDSDAPSSAQMKLLAMAYGADSIESVAKDEKKRKSSNKEGKEKMSDDDRERKEKKRNDIEKIERKRREENKRERKERRDSVEIKEEREESENCHRHSHRKDKSERKENVEMKRRDKRRGESVEIKRRESVEIKIEKEEESEDDRHHHHRKSKKSRRE